MLTTIKKTIRVAIVIMALVSCAQFATGGMGNAKEEQTMAGPTERDAKVLAEVSYISTVVSTNYLFLTAYMTETAKSEMFSFCKKMRIEGKDYFMPDFCKLKYVVVGGLDTKGCVAGFYNPFYDTWLVFSMDDSAKVVIDGFRVVRGSYFTGAADTDYPPASGAIPADEYLKGVFAQTKSALTSMRDKFCGKDFRSLFEQLPAFDVELVKKLTELTKFRIGQALKVAEDKRVLRDAVICNSIICRGRTERFVSEDASTKLTVKTLAESLGSIRSGFKIVSYFPSGDESNLMYYNRLFPTLLIQANVCEDGKVWLRMFDAHSISKDIK